MHFTSHSQSAELASTTPHSPSSPVATLHLICGGGATVLPLLHLARGVEILGPLQHLDLIFLYLNQYIEFSYRNLQELEPVGFIFHPKSTFCFIWDFQHLGIGAEACHTENSQDPASLLASLD